MIPQPSISEIVPGLFIGNLWTTYSVNFLEQHHIKSILSVNDESHALWGVENFTALIPAARHRRIFCLDNHTQDLLLHMREACDFIEESLPHGNVLVHCVHGRSRSATFVIAYLMRQRRRSLSEILAEVQQKRSRVKPSENFLAQLEVWGQVEYEIWEDENKKMPKEPYAMLLKEKGLTGELPKKPANLEDW